MEERQQPATIAESIGATGEYGGSGAYPVAVAEPTEWGLQIVEGAALIRRETIARTIDAARAKGARGARLTAADTDALVLVALRAATMLTDSAITSIGAMTTALLSERESAAGAADGLRTSLGNLIPLLTGDGARQAADLAHDAPAPLVFRAACGQAALRASAVEELASGRDIGTSAAVSLAVSAAVETVRRAGPDAVRLAIAILSEIAERGEAEGGDE